MTDETYEIQKRTAEAILTLIAMFDVFPFKKEARRRGDERLASRMWAVYLESHE
jgi:hypothetical protein